MHQLVLRPIQGNYVICKLDPQHDVTPWLAKVGQSEGFYSITRTEDELSIVCHESDAPDFAEVESGWWMLRIVGTLAFDLTGIVASITSAIAGAEVGVFVISTYDTDYILVKSHDFSQAVDAIRNAGHVVESA